MSWKSPIKITTTPIEAVPYDRQTSIVEQAKNKLAEFYDNAVVTQIRYQINVDVDKEELVKALKYDRDQYNKGYQDAKAIIERREKKLEYALLLMVQQYCECKSHLDHQFMFAGEEAFRVLGITLDTSVEEIEKRIDDLEKEGM